MKAHTEFEVLGVFRSGDGYGFTITKHPAKVFQIVLSGKTLADISSDSPLKLSENLHAFLRCLAFWLEHTGRTLRGQIAVTRTAVEDPAFQAHLQGCWKDLA
jgi:hypothetical protein